MISAMSVEPIVLVITGPVGSGKTTVAGAVGELLTELGEPGAVIDVDGLRAAWPQDPADPFHEELGRENLAAIWPNLLRRNIRWLVLADVVEHQQQRDLYQRAMPGAKIIIVRLDTPLELVRRRLLGRESDATIGWYLHRAAELQSIMVGRSIGDLVIDVGERTPRELAAAVLDGVRAVEPVQPRRDM
jgi:predicted kinase